VAFTLPKCQGKRRTCRHASRKLARNSLHLLQTGLHKITDDQTDAPVTVEPLNDANDQQLFLWLGWINHNPGGNWHLLLAAKCEQHLI
jgi:hypothetical protein